MREQALLEAGDEHRVELEALRRMHGHQLQRGPAFRRLRVAGLERRVREERGQRIGRAFVGAGRSRRRRVGATRSDSIGASTASSASRTKPSAALTSSSRFSIRSCAVLLLPVVREQAPTPRSRARPPRAAAAPASPARMLSISLHERRERRARLARRARRAHAACHSARAAAPRARSCSCSSVRAPMPRGGKLTTRRNAPSSSGAAMQAQVGERVLDLGALEEAHAAVDAIRQRRR